MYVNNCVKILFIFQSEPVIRTETWNTYFLESKIWIDRTEPRPEHFSTWRNPNFFGNLNLKPEPFLIFLRKPIPNPWPTFRETGIVEFGSYISRIYALYLIKFDFSIPFCYIYSLKDMFCIAFTILRYFFIRNIFNHLLF